MRSPANSTEMEGNRLINKATETFSKPWQHLECSIALCLNRFVSSALSVDTFFRADFCSWIDWAEILKITFCINSKGLIHETQAANFCANCSCNHAYIIFAIHYISITNAIISIWMHLRMIYTVCSAHVSWMCVLMWAYMNKKTAQTRPQKLCSANSKHFSVNMKAKKWLTVRGHFWLAKKITGCCLFPLF